MRKAKIISLEEFKNKIETIKSNIPTFSKRIDKDLEKVEFDWENYEIYKFTDEGQELNIKVLDNGLPVFWIWAGGDWENPVSFIIYWSGKELRAYIPSAGNNYNTKTKSAFGNNEDELVEEQDEEAMIKDILQRIEII